ncbi:MAG: glycoside hydrolase family 18 protein [Terriglobales bacterium]
MTIDLKPAKSSFRLAMVLLAALGILCANGLAEERAKGSIPKPPKRLIGDYSESSKYQTPPYTAQQIPYAKLTHIIHFCLGFYSDGSLYVGGLLEPALIRKAHQNGVKVLLGLCGPFNEFDDNPAAMATLVGNVWMFANEHGYDGVDVDWEYPTIGEANTFYSLMASLRAAFSSPTYLISADVPPWAGAGYALPQVDQFVDFFNIMMYECAGPWTSDGQLNAQIIWDSNDTDPWECQPGGAANEAIAIFLENGVPASQLNMGTPFYGYIYYNVSELWGPCPNASHTRDGACDSYVWPQNYGTYFKQRINKKGWETFYDQVAMVPYMLRTDGKPGFITYDDEFSTYYRVWYSDWQQNLGGTFIWSIDADYDGQSQDLLNQAYAASLTPVN